jgi:hypothetical protein
LNAHREPGSFEARLMEMLKPRDRASDRDPADEREASARAG